MDRSLALAELAERVATGRIRKVAMLTGAGVSVAAGIPDFRSPGGMYDTLQPKKLTATPEQRMDMAADPTTVVSWRLFKDNPLPYLEVRRPFILGVGAGEWQGTCAHYFAKVLHEKGMLINRGCFTQNIDGLDYQTGLSDDVVIPVHGSLGRASCEMCGAAMDFGAFQAAVRRQIRNIYDDDGQDLEAPEASSPVLCTRCGKPGIKPSTVLYGRGLPQAFFEAVEDDLPEADLLIVAGTSLTVSPANQTVAWVRKDCTRLVINREPVGEDLGLRFAGSAAGGSAAGGSGGSGGSGAAADEEFKASRDFFLGGECDAGFLDLARSLGLLADLAKYRDRMAPASRQALDACLSKAGAAAVGAAVVQGEGKADAAES